MAEKPPYTPKKKTIFYDILRYAAIIKSKPKI